MKLLLTVLVSLPVAFVSVRAQQHENPSPVEVQDIINRVNADLRGQAEEEAEAAHRRSASLGTPAALVPARPSTVSVQSLRHRVPKEAQQAFDRALKALKKGRDAAAVAAAARELESAVDLDPSFPAAHSELGVQYFQLGRSEDALLHFRRAVELDSGSSRFHSDLAWTQLRMGDKAAAERSARRALELLPGNLPAHLLLGALLTQEPHTFLEGWQHIDAALGLGTKRK